MHRRFKSIVLVVLVAMVSPARLLASDEGLPPSAPSYASDTCSDGLVALKVAIHASLSDQPLLYVKAGMTYEECVHSYLQGSGHYYRLIWCRIMSDRAEIAAAAALRDLQNADDEQQNLTNVAADVNHFYATSMYPISADDATSHAWWAWMKALIQRVPSGANMSWSDIAQ